jgi:hypothetical protein
MQKEGHHEAHEEHEGKTEKRSLRALRGDEFELDSHTVFPHMGLHSRH